MICRLRRFDLMIPAPSSRDKWNDNRDGANRNVSEIAPAGSPASPAENSSLTIWTRASWESVAQKYAMSFSIIVSVYAMIGSLDHLLAIFFHYRLYCKDLFRPALFFVQNRSPLAAMGARFAERKKKWGRLDRFDSFLDKVALAFGVLVLLTAFAVPVAYKVGYVTGAAGGVLLTANR